MNEWEWQLLEERTGHESVCVNGVELRKGDVVRLQPKAGGDIFDLALAGRKAIIESIEQDYEGALHLAVVMEDDPGRDLGMLRQPGHRFFFTPGEVEPLVHARDFGQNGSVAEAPAGQPRILVAGIGNIFHGDDGFGVEVATRLSARKFIETVAVKDFGIRGYDLAYALLDGYDFVILVDASRRGEKPGTLYVMELDPREDTASHPDAAQGAVLDAHAMSPVSVLQLARRIGDVTSRILLVACEPATLGGDDGQLGLSEVVEETVDRAAAMVEKMVAAILTGGKPEQAL